MPNVFPDLLTLDLTTVTFESFRPGVDIAHLHRPSEPEGPALALLRYAPGATVPWHEHTGLETILVLSGSQSDDAGTYAAGTLVVNEAGTRHRVWSDAGCVVLIAWAAPVRILDEPT
ncbi:cupin domain-containing protein [Jiella sp. MQZ9-1]|uniref:Cupin domain-containing protein n=1 Tax=Jiella flava TaxID=2816857 RepID=A0A939JV73_9HYPH|nr:cupin domain-containing protein [Jiella flava]MBO0660981.1 cupin domain-containing protein [Jiella flava]MCD2469629.1 cupin domain-containing protein [Jiella flava]